MAHQLAMKNGRASMMYVGTTPWHGLGTSLDSPATAAEAMLAAQLDYQVDLRPMKTIDEAPIPNRQAVVRTDTHQVLGVVGNSYTPIQNKECFSFLDAMVSEGGVRYHTAGALGRGERVWLLAKLPGHVRVKGTDDITEQFLLLSNSHDGTSALRVYFTPIRVVCANTLAAAEHRSGGSGVTILHKGDLVGKVREAQQVLGLARHYFDDVQAGVDRLADHRPTQEQLQEYFWQLYPDPLDSESRRAANVRLELLRLFEEGRGQDLPGVRHTTWAAFNAVTEYVDHFRPTRARTAEARASKRLESNWFGSGARLKSRAWNLALRMAAQN